MLIFIKLGLSFLPFISKNLQGFVVRAFETESGSLRRQKR